MKNFFGVNRTISEKSIEIDGNVFLSAKVSNTQKKQTEEFAKRINSLQEKPDVAIPMQILRYFLLAGILGAVTFLYHCLETTPQETIEAEGYLPIIALVSACLYFLLFYPQSRSAQEAGSEFRALYISDSGSSIEEESKNQLSIPDKAEKIDVILTIYKEKKGKESVAHYLNLPVWIYQKEGEVCLGNLQEEYRVPNHCMVGIQWIQKDLRLPFWNKKTQPPAAYGLKGNAVKGYQVRNYLKIICRYREEDFFILIPEYDVRFIKTYLPTDL